MSQALCSLSFVEPLCRARAGTSQRLNGLLGEDQKHSKQDFPPTDAMGRRRKGWPYELIIYVTSTEIIELLRLLDDAYGQVVGFMGS